MDLQNHTALVTGGAGHIGYAACEALAELGSAVVILDKVQEKCDSVALQIREKYKGQTLALAIDLADEEAVRSIPTRVLDHFGQLDILINCAAFVGTSALKGWVVPFLEQRVDTWRMAVEVNLTVPFLLAQICAKTLAKSGKGTIINIDSIYGLVGPDMRLYEGTQMGNPAAYAASKGGLLQLTRWLATVLAPDIRVNAITPGGVWRNQTEDFHTRYATRTPLARMATEEDFKGAVAYLASGLSAYVTGHNLVVDGGWTVW